MRTALVLLLTVLLVGGVVLGCKKGPAPTGKVPPPKIIKKVPEDTNPLRKTYEAEELGAGMTKGELSADPAASNQMTLYAKAGTVKPQEYIAWGPYEEIAPGRYVARWRIKATNLPSGDTPVLSLDVSGYPRGDKSRYTTILSKTLTTKSFPDPSKYYTFDIVFENKEPFIFELRTQSLTNCDVWLDWASMELTQ